MQAKTDGESTRWRAGASEGAGAHPEIVLQRLELSSCPRPRDPAQPGSDQQATETAVVLKRDGRAGCSAHHGLSPRTCVWWLLSVTRFVHNNNFLLYQLHELVSILLN